MLPDFFANEPRHVEEFDTWWERRYWEVVFGATARARFGMVEGGPELLRQFAAVYRGDSVPSHQVTAFPLAGERFDGRLFWAVFHRFADRCRAGLGNNEWTNFNYGRCTGPSAAP